jgi:molybdenum cofactor biosynthesis enzyme MoaA
MTGSVDLLRSRLESIAIEVTSKCNLRCAYCHKADPALEAQPGANDDMTDEMIAELYRYCKEAGIKNVTLSVGGETTMTAGWHRRIAQFLDDRDIEVYMVSNFVRLFDDEELIALTKFRYLQVSFDSAEFEMVRKMRSRADLRSVTYNILRLRQKARELGRHPFLLVNCTVCRENIGHIGQLAGLCREMAVDQLLLTPMMQKTTHRGPNQPETLNGLSSAEVILLAKNVLAAEEVLHGSTTSLRLQDHLQAQLAKVIERIRDGMIPADAAADFHRRFESSGCRQPWSNPLVGATGIVWACCGAYDHRKPIGKLGLQTMAEILDGNAIRMVRASILEGQPVVACDSCAFTSNACLAEFVREIREWQGDTEPSSAFRTVRV